MWPKPLAERLLESTRESDGQVEVGVRPPDIELRPYRELGMPVKVRIREFLGEDVLLTLDAQGQKVTDDWATPPRAVEGDSAVAVPRADRVHFFSTLYT